MKTQKGTLKFFDPRKGYGFIVPDKGGADVFAHATARWNAVLTESGYVLGDDEPANEREPQGGDRVVFEITGERKAGNPEGTWALTFEVVTNHADEQRDVRKQRGSGGGNQTSRRPWYTLPYSAAASTETLPAEVASVPVSTELDSATSESLLARGMILSFDTEKSKGVLKKDGSDGLQVVFDLKGRRQMTSEGDIADEVENAGATPVEGDRIAFIFAPKGKGKPRALAWMLPAKDKPQKHVAKPSQGEAVGDPMPVPQGRNSAGVTMTPADVVIH